MTQFIKKFDEELKEFIEEASSSDILKLTQHLKKISDDLDIVFNLNKIKKYYQEKYVDQVKKKKLYKKAKLIYLIKHYTKKTFNEQHIDFIWEIKCEDDNLQFICKFILDKSDESWSIKYDIKYQEQNLYTNRFRYSFNDFNPDNLLKIEKSDIWEFLNTDEITSRKFFTDLVESVIDQNKYLKNTDEKLTKKFFNVK